jgi:hypothetical protein
VATDVAEPGTALGTASCVGGGAGTAGDIVATTAGVAKGEGKVTDGCGIVVVWKEGGGEGAAEFFFKVGAVERAGVPVAEVM